MSDHNTKVSTLYIDLENYVHLVMMGPFLIGSLEGYSFYDPFKFISRLKGVLMESCDVEALIDQFSNYAETSEAVKMVELANEYDVPRNWAKVMTMCLRRSLGSTPMENGRSVI